MADAAQQLLALQQSIAQLVQAMQAQAQAQQAGQPAPPTLLPYEGGALDLNSRSGQTLYLEACKPIQATYSGKLEELVLFIADLKEKARRCKWNDPAHGITTFVKNNVTYNLFDDYGQLTFQDIELARTLRDNGNDARAKQNAVMMHECIYASVTGDAKTRLISTLEHHQDGPTTFFTIISSTFTTTFNHSQSIRMSLQTLNPKKFEYNITKVNEFVRLSVPMMKHGSTGQEISNSEALFYLFNAYKRIKAPRSWVSFIDFLENQVGKRPTKVHDASSHE